MSIYRGAGGAGDAVADSSSEALLVRELAIEVQADADAAAASATSASGSASAAATSATSAANSATSAATSATNAANSASSMSSSVAAAAASATAAASSATSASGSATTATTQATNASNSASAASTSATNASNSASAAATSATNASNSASAAATSATNAASSATSASGSASTATTQASNASTSATNAAASATSAAGSATTATTQAGIATTQATNASASASTASTAATTATTQAGIATTQASNASTSATSAASSATSAAASYDSFDDRYLGAKSSAPTLDNDGAALLNGALYFDSSLAAMRVYNTATSTWATIQQGLTNTETTRHSIRPSLLLDFANTKTLDPRITFTRASTGTYYDGKTTVKAEENLLVQSQTFETTWSISGTNAGITANSSTAPDGTTTADTIKEDAADGVHLCFQSGITVSGVVTLSVFAKLGSGTRFLTIGLNRDATHCGSATFDLSTGANTQTQASGGIYSSPSATITAVAQGFYRCTFTITVDTATQVRIGLNNTGTPATNNRGFGANYVGDNTSSIILWGAQLEQRSSVTAYTPTTTQAITNYIPALQTATSGTARFDHNPTTGESLGLLIEEQRTNLLTYSEQFNDASWTKLQSSIDANTVVTPDGTLTGDKLVEDTTNNVHRVYRTTGITIVSGTAYTISGYFKAGGRSIFGMYFTDGTTTFAREFNISTETSTTISGVTSASSWSLTSVGNGWYRCSITATATGISGGWQIRMNNAAGVSSYTGDGFSGIYIWGAQLEAGSFATSYIPTVASQVTRSADSASMTGTNFSSWYRADEGTLYIDGVRANGANATFPRFAGLYQNGVETSSLGIGQWSPTSRIEANVYGNGATQAAPFVTVSGAVYGTAIKGALAYKVNDFAFSANGVAAATDTSGTVPIVNSLYLGSNGTQMPLNGTLKKVSYYPLRLTNAEIQSLTTI